MELVKLFNNEKELVEFLNEVEFVGLITECFGGGYEIIFKETIVFRDRFENDFTYISNKITMSSNMEYIYIWDDIGECFISLTKYDKLVEKISKFVKENKDGN